MQLCSSSRAGSSGTEGAGFGIEAQYFTAIINEDIFLLPAVRT